MSDFTSVIESIDTLTGETIAKMLYREPSSTLAERETLFNNTNKLIDAGLQKGTVHGLSIALKAAQWEVNYFCGEDGIDVRQTISGKMDAFMAVGNDIAATLIHNNMQTAKQADPQVNPYTTGEQVFDLMIKAMRLQDQTIDPAVKSPFSNKNEDYVQKFQVEMLELVRLRDDYHAKSAHYNKTHPVKMTTDKEPIIIQMPVATTTPAPGMTG